MRLPRDISGRELIKLLGKLDYAEDRRESSHITIATQRNGHHSVTVPDQKQLRPGMLRRILREVARHSGLAHEELLQLLFA
jgi:predicted RNA binding protein YcfA (HicA-like mRNA interferase family)